MLTAARGAPIPPASPAPRAARCAPPHQPFTVLLAAAASPASWRLLAAPTLQMLDKRLQPPSHPRFLKGRAATSRRKRYLAAAAGLWPRCRALALRAHGAGGCPRLPWLLVAHGGCGAARAAARRAVARRGARAAALHASCGRARRRVCAAACAAGCGSGPQCVCVKNVYIFRLSKLAPRHVAL